MRCLLAIVVAIAAVVGGCIESQLLPCGELACAPGNVCVESGCATPDQVTACEGRADREPCDTGHIVGACTGGACRQIVCGDGIIEGDESCDDGNSTNNDGCAANCASDETCGNGVVDFVRGEQCDDGNLLDGDGCTHDCKLAACGDGIPDIGEGCDEGAENSISPDATCRPDCMTQRCGDHVVDSSHGEVCDDGGNTAGDGCSTDCRSDETCGNGVVDGIANEQCDDGAVTTSHDGCTAHCTVEIPLWTDSSPSGIPARDDSVMALDTTRNRLVVFGGSSRSGSLDDTWEFDGINWIKVSPAAAPSVRFSAAMAYDPVRRRMVLFGGYASSMNGLSNDTWEYDGITWTRVMTAHAPSVRDGAAMTYSPQHGGLILFGGDTTSSLLADTWLYNGTDWQPVPTSSAPSARWHAALAFDQTNNRVVLFGGDAALGGSIQTDTWQLSGTTWTPLTTTGTPSIEEWPQLVADTTRGALVLIGTNNFLETWELSGTTWTKTAAGTGTRFSFVAGYMPTTQRTIAFGGYSSGTIYGDLYAYNGTSWSSLPITSQPAARTDYMATFDRDRGRTVLFGGQPTNPPYFNDTWEFDGTSWIQMMPAQSPGARVAGAIAYDVSRKRTVLFGGYNNVGSLGDTWEYNGATWSPITTANAPSARGASAMAYDPIRHRIVLFGGAGPGATKADTWEYDGINWSPITTPQSPPATSYGRMTYDAARSRVTLVVGGTSSSAPLAVWDYDGATWTQRTTNAPPPPRYAEMVVYDEARKTLLLFGGFGPPIGGIGTYVSRSDLWELAGGTWTEIASPIIPEARDRGTLVYDPIRRRSMVFGGQQNFGALGDTWSFAFTSAALGPERCVRATEDSDADGLAGCADPDCAGRCEGCGDSTCNAWLEDYMICPLDCAAP